MSDDKKTVQTSEEVQAKVIEDFGFNPETQGEQIEKLTNERIESQKNLSKTIEQKARYREQSVNAGIIDSKTFEPIEKKPDGTIINKSNTEQGSLSREEGIFFAKGGDEKDLQYAKKVAELEGISLSEAMGSEFYINKVEARKSEEKVSSNQLRVSNGVQMNESHKEKPIGEMTREEHMANIKKTVPDLH